MPNAEWELVESRLLVKYGIIEIPQTARRSAGVKVVTRLERTPENRYDNFKYPFPKTHLGYAQAMLGDVVVHTNEIQFDTQEIFYWDGIANQQYINELCLAFQLQLWMFEQSFNIFSQTPLFPDAVDLQACPYDRLRFRLYNNASVSVHLYQLAVVNRCSIQNFEWHDPASTPPEIPDLPNEPNPDDEDGFYDTPTAPYDDVTDDNGETYSAEPPIPPPPDPNTAYLVIISYTIVDLDGNQNSPTFNEVIVGGVTTPTIESYSSSGSINAARLVFYHLVSGTRRELGTSYAWKPTQATITLNSFTQTPQ